jgi:hypothetical protein
MAKNITAYQLAQLQFVRSASGIIQQPASAVEGGTPLYDDDATFNNGDLVILASAVRAASSNGSDRANPNARGILIFVDVTAVPGVDTITVTLQGKDPASGKYYTILASAAIVATGTVVLRVYPGLTAAANLVASDLLPRTWRIIVTHSAGTNFTYSVGASLIT